MTLIGYTIRGSEPGRGSARIAAGAIDTIAYDVGTNGVGRRTSMNDSSGSTAWVYDERGRLTQESKTITGADNNPYVTNWSYDSAGRLVTTTYPDSGREEVTVTYNPQGLPETLTGGTAYVVAAEYSALDQLEVLDVGSGGQRTYSYYGPEGNHRLQRIQLLGAEVTFDLSYTYDNVGNVATISDAADDGAVQQFEYDFLDRLISAEGAYPAIYRYDATGNMELKVRGSNTTDMEYDQSPPVHAPKTVNGVAYLYDANGNLIDANRRFLAWDHENRLIQDAYRGERTSDYTYDGDGALVKRETETETTVQISQYYEQNLTSGRERVYYFFPSVGSGQRVAMREDGVVRFIHTDHLHSSNLVTEQDGSQVTGGLIRFYPYGETRIGSTDEMPTDYLFAGAWKERSPGGMIHMGARFYHQALGRWISPDSIVPDPANPQSLNRYTYTLGNPLRFIDPTGLFTEEELIDWGAYTAEDLRWLAEYQVNWYNYLMQAAVGDAFAFAREWAVGLGQFLLDDYDRLYIGGGFWTVESGGQTGGSFQEWGNAIGQSAVQTGILAPEERILDQLPNPHIQLYGKAAEANATFVAGIDIASTAITYFGYSIVLLDTIAMPMNPAGKTFGFGVAKFGSGLATVSMLDTLVTSGPNSRGFAVSLATWALGWPPTGLVSGPVQVAYDIYTLERIKMQNRR